jgi:acyl-CoA synthetase (AMP-forming)/AMP-acid ligase II
VTDGTTLNALLERAVSFPDTGIRVLDRAERVSWLSWPEVAARADRVAGGLQALGVARGDRIALVYPTCSEFFDSFFGILLAGAVPVPLYPPQRFGRLDEYTHRTAAMVRAVDARLVMADTRVRRLLGPAIEGARPPLGCRTITSLPAKPREPVAVGEEDLALVQFSSGTTVDPKPVALSHRAVVEQTKCLNGLWPPEDGRLDSGVSWLPLYHDMGLIGCVFPALERPGTLTLIPPGVFVTRPAIWLRTISRFRATLSPAPNFAFGLCVNKVRDEEMEGVDLGSWRLALNGAEPVAPRVLRAFQKRFAAWGFRPQSLTPVYGLSEATLAVTFADLATGFTSRFFDREALASSCRAIEVEGGVEIVSVGRPLRGFELRIVDRNHRELSEGRLGRLLVRGPSLMDGYLGGRTATDEAFHDGWLDTGDLGFLSDGELYLTGRAKDVLILRGRNHSPVEVEHAVDDVAGARVGCSVAASFLPEGADGEALVLLVEAREAITPVHYAEIAKAAARSVRAATGLAPDHVEVVAPGTLPRTSSGKLRRHEALRRWRQDELVPPKRVTPLRLAGAVARSSLAMARAERRRRHG